MKAFDCSKCGAPVVYDPNLANSARCTYCHSQLSLPDERHGRPAQIIPKIDIKIGPEAAATAKRALWILVLIPVLVVGGLLIATFGIYRGLRGTNVPGIGTPGGARTADRANDFARPVMNFGTEGIGPGMMTDARSIALDAKGNIYVGEYSGGRIQVFDTNGNFITQWLVDRKMPLRGLAADRKGTVYVVQYGAIKRYDGQTGESLGTISYDEGDGFDDVTTTADGGLVCAWRRSRDDIIRFDSTGKVVQTIRSAISTAADRTELNTRVAVDGSGNIYALGSFTNGVFKFSPEGKFLNRFGGPGNQAGQLSAVSAIAVDGKGRVFVSDIKGVQVFDSDGRYLNTFKPGGVASGMVFNDKGELFIVSRTKVTKFVLNQ